jgi:hypothetical protein
MEGIVLVKARDVTTRECIAKINSILLTMPCFEDLVAVQNLQEQVQHLIQLPQAIISLASFRKTRKGTTEYESEDSKSLLLQPLCFIQEDSEVCELMKVLFENRTSLAVNSLPGTLLSRFPFLQDYADKGVTSLALFPLKIRNELVGIFSIVTCTGAGIVQHHVEKAEALIPLLVLALSKQYEKISDEIDRVIKEQFTAVQSSVNWKFTEAARNYIRKKNKGEPGEIETIVFEKVFPLYGSIDVRNSSVERTRAIQKDLLEHLHLAENIIEKCTKEFYLFSLKEIGFRLKKFISIASKVLFPGDELTIQNFLDEEIAGLFKHLKKTVPGISDEVDHYFYLLHANTHKVSRQCAAFEESMAMINSELVKFVNQEQARVQEIYAHYFEYFISDGLDFNIYIGQSITPDKPFDDFYLKNLKLWQLTTLVKAARLVKDLQGAIPVPLETTQLILAHSKPLSISFRVGERKFDVDGAYNMHYEIIKKRIDKIKIMGSCERLTQPGKIAIVFTHDKEAQEYSSYIEFLQSEGLLDKEIEYCDLEELPGVRGLKAIRVGIRMGLVAGACPAINDSYPLQAAV